MIEAKNVQLQIELVALRAEMKLAEQGREAEKTELAERQQERDDLVSERDDLRSENKGLVASEAEAKGQHDELLANLETVLSHQPKQVEVEKTNSTYIVLAVAITALFAVLIIMFVSYRKGKEFNHLVRITQPSLLEQAAKNKQRGAELDRQAKELEKQKREVDELCRETEKLRANLDARDASLNVAADELDERDCTLRRRNSELNSREAGLYLREETLVASQTLLEGARRALRQDRITHHEEARRLAVLRDRVEAGLRTLDEDGPALTRDRQAVERQVGEVTQRTDAVLAREVDAERREDEVVLREQVVSRREDEVSRREGEVADQLAVLPQREQDVQAAEENLARAEDDLRRKRAEFERSMAEARQELEDKARGLSDWEDRLRQAEQAKAAPEDGADDGDDNPTAVVLPSPPEGVVDPRGATHIDAPGSEPAMGVSKCLCPDCGHEVPFARLDEHRAAAHGVGAGEESPGPAETCTREDGEEVRLEDLKAHLGTCSPADITCGVCRRSFVDRREFDDHRTGCPEAVPHTPTIPGPSAASDVTSPRETGPQIPIADRPSHEENGFYCTVCFKSFSAEEYARDHAAHNTGLTKPE
ncbi:MAG: hypothetical protein ABII19_01600 [Patescibacteria group bacterium]